MARPKKGEPGHEQASKRWRETMEAKYGGPEGLHKKMQEMGAIGGRNGNGPDYRAGFADDRIGPDGLTGYERRSDKSPYQEECAMTEHQLYELIAEYMQVHYPDVIYRFDLASDLKLTPGQARRHKKLHPKRGFPDLFIAEPAGKYAGLYIEVKKDGESPFKKNGELKKDEHLEEQAEMLERLEFRGYKAVFGVGADEVMRIIDDYMGGGDDLGIIRS